MKKKKFYALSFESQKDSDTNVSLTIYDSLEEARDAMISESINPHEMFVYEITLTGTLELTHTVK